ncbi:phosphate ABC transporter ATP-binding protein [Tepidicella baoligensis]|uniref:ABC transporter ATP-binding protein n=1 Tax=Tepidicella baoligensis TaxID=2707016 RepID=UPI0015D966A0|nr:phosphate ABC transporter ATP-binding protein [Tepidicella baoligensis]
MTALFEWRGVDVRLGGNGQVHALRNVSLRIAPGERVAVIGPNGSGKSTLLRALHGLVRVSAGQAMAQPRTGPHAVRQAMLFQRPFLLRLSALHNIRLGLWLAGNHTWRQTRAPAWEALERVGLADVADRNGRALSGGQQQRLALARAWALKPQVWLLDEPTASLDPHAKRDVEQLMASFAQEPGATMVFSSHNLGQVKRLAQRVLYLESGQLLADLPVERFFNESVLQAVSPQALAFIKGEV